MSIFFWIMWTILYLPMRILYPTKIVNKKTFFDKNKAIIACNHTSNIDIILVKSRQHTKSYVLAKHTLFKNKFLGACLKSFGGIPVNREAVDLSTIKQTLKVLKDGHQLIIFPEGTRKNSINETESVKTGMIMFALKSNSPIIPMVLLKRPRIFTLNKILVGEPIDFSKYKEEKQTKELLQKLSNIVLIQMQTLREQYYQEQRLKKAKRTQKHKFIS